jgi:hypothetical protein
MVVATCGIALDVQPPAYVDGAMFPFDRRFFVENCVRVSALEIEVGTFYVDYAVRASVWINNFQVGKIPPLPIGTLGNELAPVSFHFGNGMMQIRNPAIPASATGFNHLRIVPFTANDPLIVGRWRLFYEQDI